MKEKLIVYWSRRDFRLRDNPALVAATEKARTERIPLLPLFILEDYMRNGDPEFQFGYPSRFFLAQALPIFAGQFPTFTLFTGKAAQTLVLLSRTFEIEIFVNEDVYPDFYKQLNKIKASGIVVHLYKDQLTIDRNTKTGAGNHYSVFTPFKKAVWESFVNTKESPRIDFTGVTFFDYPSQDHTDLRTVQPVTVDGVWKSFEHTRSLRIGDTTIDIDALLPFSPALSHWYTSEAQAHSRFGEFLKSGMSEYKDNRDGLSTKGTSKMSLALAWGLISARTLVARIQEHYGESFDNPFSARVDQGAIHFISELIWREFYKYLFFHTPSLMHTEFQARFRGTIAWIGDSEARSRFTAWITGKTGYKVVDAAMMELAHTGWMHNRARMIVASVLTKNLGVDWRWGQEYFRAMLIDLDEASNNGGWQWGASVGADPKPIRIFNPYLQAENYDSDGTYQKKWLGEERYLEVEEPIVAHKDARAQALQRYGLSESKDGFARDF